MYAFRATKEVILTYPIVRYTSCVDLNLNYVKIIEKINVYNVYR